MVEKQPGREGWQAGESAATWARDVRAAGMVGAHLSVGLIDLI